MQQDFLRALKEFKRDEIPDKVKRAVRKYINDEELEVSKVMSKSVAAAGIMQWCHAIYGYSMAVEIVAPLQEKVN